MDTEASYKTVGGSGDAGSDLNHHKAFLLDERQHALVSIHFIKVCRHN